jgi:hypothetical protein
MGVKLAQKGNSHMTGLVKLDLYVGAEVVVGGILHDQEVAQLMPMHLGI